MFTLPSLITRDGQFRLPLAESTAERLVDGLLHGDEQRRREAFRAAVAGDPVFAVWTLAQLHAGGVEGLTTAAAIADWLADRPASFFLPADGASGCEQESLLEEFAEPAGCSLAVAELAEQFARETGAVAEQAYLLGLVHLGSAWLAESSQGDAPPRLTGMALPTWLMRATLQFELPPEQQTQEVTCVAQAMALVCSELSDEWRAMSRDARHWIGRWALLGEAWRKPGPWGQRLAALVERLTALDRLQTQFDRALETAKLEAIKELAYGAGHEINNPLANISARAQTLLRDETDPERRRTLAAINTQAFRAHEMIADLMLFARPPQPQRASCDAAEILRMLVDELSPQAAEQHVRFKLELPPAPASLFADPMQIAVAVRSLLVNSLEALVTGGQVTIALENATGERWTRIVVSDDGPGIPADTRGKIFDPFFSGREAGRGLGLGLSKCWRIVSMHGGRIEVANAPDRGATFTIWLPTAS